MGSGGGTEDFSGFIMIKSSKQPMDEQRQALLAGLPKIDELLLLLGNGSVSVKASKDIVKDMCRSAVASLRDRIMKGEGDKAEFSMPTVHQVADQVRLAVDGLYEYRLRRVINATGIVLHTNLGRAPLCAEAMERIAEVGGGYSNLEYDLEKGQRGLRYDHVRKLLCVLSGADDALVVNNNAAAVLLVLNTLAEGKEAIVSRGELIEIGGEFRIPDIMAKSGAALREVGTTNRTHFTDYERAICVNTGLILKVHTSNYRIVGFTESIELSALVELGKRAGIPVMDDLGSGCFVELDRYGLQGEPTIRQVLATGVDVVTFSGDKLLGGPQAGIILGQEEILERIRRNPLNRALRIDKFTLAALEATMMQYLRPDDAVNRLRVLRSLTEPAASVERRARRLLAALRRLELAGMKLSLRKDSSQAGGGSLPTEKIPTVLVTVRPVSLSPSAFEKRLRSLPVPIIARISNDEVLLDLRTIDDGEIPLVKEGFKILRDTG